MIPFEEAKNLKKGDIVFHGKTQRSVAKVKVSRKTQTVSIIFDDADSGEQEADSSQISLTRQRSANAAAKKAASPVVATKENAAPKPKAKAKRNPNLIPITKSDDPMVRIKAGFALNAQWRSLEWFEADRQKYAKRISETLKIPLKEFDDTEETACFHFMTQAIAVARWLETSGWAEIRMSDERLMNQMERTARSKAMAGILIRLFLHRFVQNIGEIPGLDRMVMAFTQASGVSSTYLGQVLTAHTYVRQCALLLAGYLAGGSEEASPINDSFFEPYRAFLDRDEDEFMPKDAVVDASMQIYCTLKYLHEKADIPVSLESLPDGEEQAHRFLSKYFTLAGMYRAPAYFQIDKLTFKNVSLASAIDSLGAEKPYVLLDSVFQNIDGSLEIVVPFNPVQRSDNGTLAALISNEGEKLPLPPSIVIATYPLL